MRAVFAHVSCCLQPLHLFRFPRASRGRWSGLPLRALRGPANSTRERQVSPEGLGEEGGAGNRRSVPGSGEEPCRPGDRTSEWRRFYRDSKLSQRRPSARSSQRGLESRE
jgi:hypothetical protein